MPNFGAKKLGKHVILDMDMSVGDFIALFYLLKVPIDVLDLKVYQSLSYIFTFA